MTPITTACRFLSRRRLFTQLSTNSIPIVSYSSSTFSTAPAAAPFPPPKLFDYATVTSNLSVVDAIDSVESAFGALANGKVDVPMPMHIGIHETVGVAGPGDCHIKGGYIEGTTTFTVKLACVSFYNNLKKGLPAGSGLFCVVDAVTGAPLAIFQENRYMTDLRTGAAGGVSLKYTTLPDTPLTIGFIGCGAIARVMARAAYAVRPNFKGIAFGMGGSSEQFCTDMSNELKGVSFTPAATAKELCQQCNVIYTQTPGGETVLELNWLRPGTTIIASGSDQPTKQEIPNDVLKASKYIADLVKQTSRVGELRGALQAGIMTEHDVYAELGEVVNGSKAGRVNNEEIIVVDLTGTGAQDAAIGQVAWDKLKAL